MSTVLAVAHRGDPYRARENTVASFRSAIAAGADMVELDVRLTRDGVPVVLHDATLDRLWGHDRPVAELTAQQVRELTAGGVPTLAEVLAVTAPVRTLIDLPMRDAAPARAAVAAVREAGAGGRVSYCGDPAALKAVRATDEAAEIGLTWKRTGPPRPAVLSDLRPAWLTYRFGLLDHALVERAHARELRVMAWTVDSPRTMRRLLAMGVDAITSNRVTELRRVIGPLSGH
ncbi:MULTISPECIES: glycerophosphodiester phosphodiesterase [unclassified Streptomyces]|uniref:glycerophosphodiester phosphodiesterase n=1 Tax=Streptomyces TaxID=1883 RepID=UPI00190506BA|nr:MULTISPECIES: glycerophosphodiester phosphodiesterase [unclassified Streptomyces]MCU4750131.1 glycerophosphodiester phosphodiesterase [Streptomyces sp. G-5]QQN76947.1 glycerophosphodiester phosphodiesterase [Streptomyces sp. XC 2026]